MTDYVKLENGRPVLKAALAASSGAGDAGKIPKLDSTGRIDQTMMPVGIGADAKVFTAAEDISARALVHVNSSGQIVNADASNDRQAVGFVTDAIANAGTGTVYFDGTISGLSGLTAGARYFLSDSTPGGIITTAPTTGAGKCSQEIGTATSTTELSFEPQTAYLLG